MKFILTKELGRLATWLRMLGFDTEYFKNTSRSKLVITALRDNRVLLTRNRHIGNPKGVRLVEINADDVTGQLREVVEKIKITINRDALFSRCTICNSALVAVDKEAIKEKVPEHVYREQGDFRRCASCDKIYWQGTHWAKVQEVIKEVGL